MTIESVDLSRLASLYRKSAEIKAIIDWLGDRERDPRNSETKVRNLKRDLSKRGERFSIDQLRQALEKIAETGCGTYKAGRPNENSRIRWGCSARELAERVLKEVERGGGNGAVVEGDDQYETHYFPVRPGILLPVKIRLDMTATELENMSEYLRIIARSRGNDSVGN